MFRPIDALKNLLSQWLGKPCSHSAGEQLGKEGSESESELTRSKNARTGTADAAEQQTISGALRKVQEIMEATQPVFIEQPEVDPEEFLRRKELGQDTAIDVPALRNKITSEMKISLEVSPILPAAKAMPKKNTNRWSK